VYGIKILDFLNVTMEESYKYFFNHLYVKEGEGKIIKIGEFNENKYDRSKRIRWLDLDSIRNTSILVAGAGALGNETAKNLVLSGYRNITIIDMDKVEISNLNRCLFFTKNDVEENRFKAEVMAERLKLLDPEVNISIIINKLEDECPELFETHDIVLGCLDNIGARLHLNAHCYKKNNAYIDGATQGMVGKVQVILSPQTSCFECNLNNTHMKTLEKRFSCSGRSIVYYEPPLSAEITTTSIISAIQVREALKISCGMTDKILHNLFYYDGLRNVTEELEIEINPNCSHH
jgi:molybdopterin/thiamine biosynthesis adenylyltransferase